IWKLEQESKIFDSPRLLSGACLRYWAGSREIFLNNNSDYFMNDLQGEQGFSIYRLRWIGYGLLILSVLDAIAVLIPANFGNRLWELQTIGAVVERVPVPLLAMALIFFGEGYDRRGLEDVFLKGVSAARSTFSVDATFGNFWHYLRQQPKQPANYYSSKSTISSVAAGGRTAE